MNTLPDYKYGGARTMVNLHGIFLWEFLEVWRIAKSIDISLPKTDHPGYQSLETLLRHILGSARGYMIWMTEQLSLPEPGIDPIPEVDRIESEANNYLDHLIHQWRTPLTDVDEIRFDNQEYVSDWGVRYCIDSMLEHAVMHPILHRVQLEELIEEQGHKA